MRLSKINELKKYFCKKEREKLFKENLEKVEQYKKQLQYKDLIELKNEKMEIEVNLCNKRFFSEYIFQIITLGVTILVLTASIGYYIVSDATGLLGYSSYINQRYELFKSANENISNINSIIVKDNNLEKDKDYLDLNKLLFEFTQYSNNRAMDICSNEDPYREYNKNFDEMITKIDGNLKWKEYKDKIYLSKKYIIEIGNINKDFSIFDVKILHIEQFYDFVFYACLALFLFFSLLIYFFRGYDDEILKKEYIFKKKFEIINNLINLKAKEIELKENLLSASKAKIKGSVRKRRALFCFEIMCKLLNLRKM